MIFWSATQCQEWCARQHLHLNAAGYLVFDTAPTFRERFVLPTDCGRRCALSKTISQLIGVAGDALVWIVQWGVFPSSENEELFEIYRGSFGEKRKLRDVPGHFVEGTCIDDTLPTLLHLCLISYWDVWVVDGSRPLFIEFTHDDVCELVSPVEDLVQTVAVDLAAFGLKQITG